MERRWNSLILSLIPTLKHLTLNGSYYPHSILTPPIWELPALTTLNLISVTLYDDSTDKCAGLFSNCANLKNLTLYNCKLKGLNDFNICHPGLSSLRLDGVRNGVNVVTPQLKNLTIIHWQWKLLISAPNLSYLHYKDSYDPLELSAEFLYLKNVDICISCTSDYKEDAQKIVSMFQQLHSVKSLTLNLKIIELSTELLRLEKVHMCINRIFAYKAYTSKIVCLLQQLSSVRYLTLNLEFVKLLSSSVELISHQPSPFVNLKSLKIYPADVTEPKVTMSTEVKNYLLDSSPGATLTMVSHEEIRAVMDVTSARNLMNELHVLVDEWKENSGTNTAHVKQDTAPFATHMETVHEQGEVENHRVHLDTKMKLNFGERVTHIKSYWEDMNEHFQKGYKNASRTISLLQKIEEVLTKLPTSCRAKLQARFSGLCAEADTIMDTVMDRIMIQFDKRPSRSNVFFHELATSSHPSS